LCVGQCVDHGFAPAEPLSHIPADNVADHESPRILPTVNDVGSVIVDCPTADCARESLADPVLTVAAIVSGFRQQRIFTCSSGATPRHSDGTIPSLIRDSGSLANLILDTRSNRRQLFRNQNQLSRQRGKGNRITVRRLNRSRNTSLQRNQQLAVSTLRGSLGNRQLPRLLSSLASLIRPNGTQPTRHNQILTVRARTKANNR
jgi:hypothetical protein